MGFKCFDVMNEALMMKMGLGLVNELKLYGLKSRNISIIHGLTSS